MSINNSIHDNIDFSNIDRNVNYQKKLDKLIDSLDKVPTLLLHSCCGPCSSYVLEYLSQYFKITVFYYNPNIYPSSEYDDRIIEQKKVIDSINAKFKIEFIEGEYKTQDFYDTVKGLENEKEGGDRCRECYKLRLKEAAILASKYNFDYFTTSLSISPHKDSHILNQIGRYYAQKYNIKYLESDFKKRNGFKRSVEITTELNIYRQEYCGCIFSKKEMEAKNKKHFALFGNPVAHSKSPIIHNTAFKKLGINAEYSAYLVNSAKEIIDICKENKIFGANITTPFKQDIIKYLDHIDEEALLTNSVNTIVNKDGKFYGYTTDGRGMLDIIPHSADTVTIIGCGAAARSIVASLSRLKINIYVIYRDKSNNYQLMKQLIDKLVNNNIVLTKELINSQYVINATTVGMKDNSNIITDYTNFYDDTIFIDLIYKSNGETKFVEEAKARHYRVYDGKLLLIKQANHSFFIWNNQFFDESELYNKL